jgi:Leucine-rich repeat (LRR) protein
MVFFKLYRCGFLSLKTLFVLLLGCKRPAAGCLTRLNLSGNFTAPSLPATLPERCPALKVTGANTLLLALRAPLSPHSRCVQELIVADNCLEALWEVAAPLSSSGSSGSGSGGPGLRCLTLLDASSNRLRPAALDAAFQSFRGGSHVTHLDLRRNGLTELPPSVFGLAQLQTLLLGRNALAALPGDGRDGSGEAPGAAAGWGALQRLGCLDLSGNQLASLGAVPAGLASCPILRTLDLSDNNLREVGRSAAAALSLSLFLGWKTCTPLCGGRCLEV